MTEEEDFIYHDAIMRTCRVWALQYQQAQSKGDKQPAASKAFNDLTIAYFDLYKKVFEKDPWNMEDGQLEKDMVKFTEIAESLRDKQDKEGA